MKFLQITGYILAWQLVLVSCQNETWDECGNDLSRPTGLDKLIDVGFLRKFFRNLVPFKKPTLTMQFFLYKQAFPNCGQEIRIDDDSLQRSGFNTAHPTRILIHGWMSQSKTAFNRNIKDAYLSLGDFNVVVVDWSVASSTLNYFKVVNVLEGFGEIVGAFAMHLHKTLGVDYDSIYLVGHSLGAQIAGSAGKFIYPAQFNTIFALDPAGPAFRGKPMECRIDPTDAKYVESIQTSVNLGLLEPVGSATFFPNKGVYQKCLGYGCSHRRAYQFFAESLTSPIGFWGTLCDKVERKWNCPEAGELFKMGGEPSLPKTGTFYVKTRATSPYALGRRLQGCSPSRHCYFFSMTADCTTSAAKGFEDDECNVVEVDGEENLVIVTFPAE